MSTESIFQTHLVLGYVAWLLCFGAYIWPRLKSMEQVEAQRATGLFGDPCLLWTSRLDANKDPLMMLAAVEQATLALPNLRLWCCYGEAPMLGKVPAALQINTFLLYRDLGWKGLDVGVGGFNLLGQQVPYLQPFNGGHAPLPGASREIVGRVSYTLGFK